MIRDLRRGPLEVFGAVVQVLGHTTLPGIAVLVYGSHSASRISGRALKSELCRPPEKAARSLASEGEESLEDYGSSHARRGVEGPNGSSTATLLHQSHGPA